MNKNILIVVYDFPPEIGGGGVMRTVKFLKYSRKSALKAFVLTVQRNTAMHMSDEILFHEVSDFEIARTKDILYSKAGGFIQAVRKNPNVTLKKRVILYLRSKFRLIEDLLIPDQNVGWIVPALIKGVKLVKEKNIDIVYATAPPFSSFIVGYLISKLTGKKFVIDYRDAWNGNPIFDSKYKFKNYLSRKLEKNVFCHSNAVIFTTDNIKDSVINTINVQPKKCKVIWNGYDEDDFSAINPNGTHNNKLNISYIGGVGSIYGQRSPKKLLDAFKKLNTTHEAELKFIGFVPGDVKEYVLNSKIKNITFIGVVNHPSAIKYMLNSNILVVLLPIEQDGLNCVPGKTFEYMRSQRPILAITPQDGQLAKLIYNYNAGIVVNGESSDEIYDGLKLLIKKNKNNYIFYDTQDIKYFSRKNQFKILTNFLSNLE